MLCKVAGNEYLHIIKAIRNGRYQIGNNRGFMGGSGLSTSMGNLRTSSLERPRPNVAISNEAQ